MPADPLNARDLFLHAVGRLPPEAWAEYVATACAGDSELERQVNEYLRVHREAGSFLDRPAVDVGLTGSLGTSRPEGPIDSGPVAAAGTVIGPYKLIEQIGEGGFGVVFLAEQTDPVRRRVALKIIKPGMDSRQVVARFEAERQALALMDHPNIAKVFDGGATSSGRPYFVMELVKGMPITKYCDDHHLTPADRLGLFVQVCHAVQHAHQKGVIHRDLKPSNVLVAPYDGRPVPKVIDFGVAKAVGQPLTEKTLVTGFGAVIGTPEYMSPEQAELNNADIDTRSDIYALGILLYELLTGTTPLTSKRVKEAGLLEVLRLVREEEPPRPSTRLSTTEELPSIAANRGLEPRKLSGLVRGELDWIVMKCLEKDRNRRYESANALAVDVERHLADEPVQACPPSAGYRFRKFARRNKAVLAAATVGVLIVLGTVAGLVANNWLVAREKKNTEVALGIALTEKDRADQNVGRAKQMIQEYFANVAQDQRLRAAGLHDLRRALLTSMVSFLQDFADRDGENEDLRNDRGWAQFNLAKIWAEVGDTDRAIAAYDRARETWAGLVADAPANAGRRAYVADCDNNRAVLLTQENRLDEAEAGFRAALAAHDRLAAEFPGAAEHPKSQGSALHGLSLVARERGDARRQREFLEQAIARQTEAVRIDPEDREAQTFLGNHHNNLGGLLLELRQPAEAEAAHRAAAAVFERSLAAAPADPTFRALVAGTHMNLGLLFNRNGLADAATAFRKAIAILDPLAAEFPCVPDYRRSLAGGYQNLADNRLRANDPGDAAATFDKAIALREQLAKEHPGDVDDALAATVSLIRRAVLDMDAGRFEAAVPPLTRTIALLEPLAGIGRRGAEAAKQLRSASGARADALYHLGRYPDALKAYDRALGLDDGTRGMYFRVKRALTLAHLKEHARATAEAEAAIQPADVPAYLLQDAAGVHALAAAAAAGDPALAEKYAARAVAILGRAFEKNYQAIAAGVADDPKLAAVRGRDDYRNLVAEWEGKLKKN